uniref:Cytochrome b5 n=1 Tax=Lygus hesperus TaxID=30085 RepID=A0A0A9WFG4_LYGHE
MSQTKEYTLEEVSYHDGGKTLGRFDKEYKDADEIRKTEIDKLRKLYKNDAWIVIYGKVYDVTSYLMSHPGGPDPILLSAGTVRSSCYSTHFPHCICFHTRSPLSFFPSNSLITPLPQDATADFEDIYHSVSAREQLQEFYIGRVVGSTEPADAVFRSRTPQSTAQVSNYLPIAILVIFLAVLAYFYFQR